MRRRTWAALGVLGALCLTLRGPQAAELVLQWEFPHDMVIDSFLVTYRASTDPGGVLQQFRVPWTAEPTCAILGAAATPDSVCARPPTCLPPGVYTLSVQAEQGEEVSEPSNWASCEALTECRYNCEQFAEANDTLLHGAEPTAPEPTAPEPTAPEPSPPPSPASPVVSTTPSLADLERLLAQLDRLIPQRPPTPIVATAPT
jgi:hypothetical protein